MSGWKQTTPLDFPSSTAILADIKQRSSHFAEPFRSIIAAVDDASPAWTSFLTYWPTEPWTDHPACGKVTLAGDAAHPMTPNRGQGLNNAVLDCHELVSQIARALSGTTTLKEAVLRYEEEMVPRGRTEVLSSLENTVAVHDWEKLMQAPIFKHGVARRKPTECE